MVLKIYFYNALDVGKEECYSYTIQILSRDISDSLPDQADNSGIFNEQHRSGTSLTVCTNWRAVKEITQLYSIYQADSAILPTTNFSERLMND